MMEAEELLRLVTAERGETQATMRQLGNQEWVVIIQLRGLDHWCWSPTDYHAFRAARTCALCDRDYEHVKPCSSCKRLVCQTCRVVAGGIKCKACYLTVVPADTPYITAQ